MVNVAAHSLGQTYVTCFTFNFAIIAVFAALFCLVLMQKSILVIESEHKILQLVKTILILDEEYIAVL